jgi:hypothetical protein
MKTILAAALALSLAGCANTDFFGDSSAGAPPPAPVAAAPAPAPVASAPEPAPAATSQADLEAMPPPTSMAAAPAPMPMPQQTASPDTGTHCTQIAKLRARDAAYAGEDSETQDSVYHRTYAECVDWAAKHRS